MKNSLKTKIKHRIIIVKRKKTKVGCVDLDSSNLKVFNISK